MAKTSMMLCAVLATAMLLFLGSQSAHAGVFMPGPAPEASGSPMPSPKPSPKPAPAHSPVAPKASPTAPKASPAPSAAKPASPVAPLNSPSSPVNGTCGAPSVCVSNCTTCAALPAPPPYCANTICVTGTPKTGPYYTCTRCCKGYGWQHATKSCQLKSGK